MLMDFLLALILTSNVNEKFNCKMANICKVINKRLGDPLINDS